MNAEPFVLDAAEVARALGSNFEREFAADEAARRLAHDGPNELRAAPPVAAWRRLLAQIAPMVGAEGKVVLCIPSDRLMAYFRRGDVVRGLYEIAVMSMQRYAAMPCRQRTSAARP